MRKIEVLFSLLQRLTSNTQRRVLFLEKPPPKTHFVCRKKTSISMVGTGQLRKLRPSEKNKNAAWNVDQLADSSRC
ncbi:hypothetical protein L596_000213 [Steinernema carpocapsae]|uniref:Uncharacterized protein n=1 Tax=Steinernema carpocapsae TaxID=34508 RepID=A0A4V6I718_STECR|nr:hypothetical protein L596_000213 [Steinernema carpocapsae]